MGIDTNTQTILRFNLRFTSSKQEKSIVLPLFYNYYEFCSFSRELRDMLIFTRKSIIMRCIQWYRVILLQNDMIIINFDSPVSISVMQIYYIIQYQRGFHKYQIWQKKWCTPKNIMTTVHPTVRQHKMHWACRQAAFPQFWEGIFFCYTYLGTCQEQVL